MTSYSADSRLRWEFTIVACMYLGYAALVLCSTTLPIAAPAMLLDVTLQMDKAVVGSLMGWGAAGAMVGKLLTGVAADRMGGRKVFIGALTVNSAATAALGCTSRHGFFKMLNFVAHLAKSAGWPAMATLIATWFEMGKYGRVWGVLSTSSRLSSVLSSLFLGAVLLIFPWRWVFVAGASVTALVVGLNMWLLKGDPAEVGLRATTSPRRHSLAPRQRGSDEVTVWVALQIFARSGRVWLICLAVTGLNVLMEFLGFLPVFLCETLSLSPGQAGIASSAFPAGALLAVLAGGWVYDKLPPRRLPAVMGGMVGLASLCLGLLWGMSRLDVGPAAEVRLAVSLVFVLGAAIAPAYYIPMSVFAVRSGGEHRGLLIGLIDACGYGGAMVFYFVAGSTVEERGWGSLLAIQIIISLASSLLIALFLYAECRSQSPAASTTPRCSELGGPSA